MRALSWESSGANQPPSPDSHGRAEASAALRKTGRTGRHRNPPSGTPVLPGSVWVTPKGPARRGAAGPHPPGARAPGQESLPRPAKGVGDDRAATRLFFWDARGHPVAQVPLALHLFSNAQRCSGRSGVFIHRAVRAQAVTPYPMGTQSGPLRPPYGSLMVALWFPHGCLMVPFWSPYAPL